MKIKFKIILRTENFDSSMLIDLIESENSIVDIKKYGYVEPLKNKINKEKLKEVQELFDNYLDIIFKGNRKFWMSVSTTTEGIMMIGGGLEIKNNEANKINEVLNFIELFSRDEQLLYGYMCSEDEYDNKHKVIERSGVFWKGVSQWDFLEFLPGIHWYTIFGKELVNSIGINVFRNLKNVVFTKPDNQSIAFHLKKSIENNDSRIKDLEDLEAKIGKEYFFNRNILESEYSHPDSYKEYLESFERGY